MDGHTVQWVLSGFRLYRASTDRSSILMAAASAAAGAVAELQDCQRHYSSQPTFVLSIDVCRCFCWGGGGAPDAPIAAEPTKVPGQEVPRLLPALCIVPKVLLQL